MNSVSETVQVQKLTTKVHESQIHLTCPNISVVLHIFRDGLCDGGLPGPRPAGNQKRRNSGLISMIDEHNHLQGYDSLPSTNFVRLCAMNLTSTNVLHFVTTSVRPGSALTGGWLESFEYGEIWQGTNLPNHGNTVRGGAFLSCWGLGILIHTDA